MRVEYIINKLIKEISLAQLDLENYQINHKKSSK